MLANWYRIQSSGSRVAARSLDSWTMGVPCSSKLGRWNWSFHLVCSRERSTRIFTSSRTIRLYLYACQTSVTFHRHPEILSLASNLSRLPRLSFCRFAASDDWGACYPVEAPSLSIRYLKCNFCTRPPSVCDSALHRAATFFSLLSPALSQVSFDYFCPQS